jgi:hypothetical protein
LKQSGIDGKADHLGAVLEVQLAQNASAISLDAFDTHENSTGDLLVGEAFGH